MCNNFLFYFRLSQKVKKVKEGEEMEEKKENFLWLGVYSYSTSPIHQASSCALALRNTL
jgi:hypothetical protein